MSFSLDLLFDRIEHARFAALVTDAKDIAELLVEIRHTDGRQADVLHMILIGVEVFGKTAECVRFTHTGAGREQADAADILEAVETIDHLLEVTGTEAVLLPKLLLVKRIGRKAVERRCHLAPPIFE